MEMTEQRRPTISYAGSVSSAHLKQKEQLKLLKNAPQDVKELWESIPSPLNKLAEQIFRSKSQKMVEFEKVIKTQKLKDRLEKNVSYSKKLIPKVYEPDSTKNPENWTFDIIKTHKVPQVFDIPKKKKKKPYGALPKDRNSITVPIKTINPFIKTRDKNDEFDSQLSEVEKEKIKWKEVKKQLGYLPNYNVQYKPLIDVTSNCEKLN